jgi:hypothetical protein
MAKRKRTKGQTNLQTLHRKITIVIYLERMLFNYYFVYKLISLKNFKIVSPTTFVNKSNICQKHPHSRPKHVSMNSWNYTEYIPVVPHYLTNN